MNTNNNAIIATFLVMIVVYLATYATYRFHPYEVCKRQYEDVMDVSECVWLLENGI